MNTLTYGRLPKRAHFEAAFDEACPNGFFKVGNDPLWGDRAFHVGELWRELVDCVDLFEDGDDAAGDWASCVLQTLGFEWV